MIRFLRPISLFFVFWLFDLHALENQPLLIARDGSPAPNITPTSSQVTFKPIIDAGTGGMVVTIQPGKDGYPGVNVTPEKPWDLSKFGHVIAKVTNTGSQPLAFSLRVDNEGDWKLSPWNVEPLNLKPGASGTVKVRFGYSWDKPAYKLKPEAVVKVLFFAGASKETQSFQVDVLEAGGTPGEKPEQDPKLLSVKPKDGILLGVGVSVDLEKQFVGKAAKASMELAEGKSALKIVFAAGSEQTVAFKPIVGRWDLRDFLEVRVNVKNLGTTPVTPRVRLNSTTGPSDWIEAPAPLAPNASQELIIPFFSTSIWNGEKGKGTQFVSDKATEVNISTGKSEGESVLLVDSIRANVPPPATPEWLGKRPPIPGKWKQTLNDNFDSIDEKTWAVLGDNYWDKRSHFSKENTLIGGGEVKLRFEKKRGHHNDDPAKPETDYTAGFLTSYGKWTQRYGYFEARMKLPSAPGLWPAFWMMPDRGPDFKEQWKRSATEKDGMEFDIMEHLTRWGPYRYNIAMHWDGYGKDHKSTGSEHIYVQPDKDGYITTGLLWSPGLLVYYNNGKEVLRWENARIASVPAYIMFTLPSGGWDNSPLDDEKLPSDFTVDYVRAWQLEDASDASAAK